MAGRRGFLGETGSSASAGLENPLGSISGYEVTIQRAADHVLDAVEPVNFHRHGGAVFAFRNPWTRHLWTRHPWTTFGPSHLDHHLAKCPIMYLCTLASKRIYHLSSNTASTAFRMTSRKSIPGPQASKPRPYRQSNDVEPSVGRRIARQEESRNTG